MVFVWKNKSGEFKSNLNIKNLLKNVNFNMKTDFILYINDSRQEKGYTKCIYVRTTGRKVKKIGHNLHIHVLNG